MFNLVSTKVKVDHLSTKVAYVGVPSTYYIVFSDNVLGQLNQISDDNPSIGRENFFGHLNASPYMVKTL